MIEYTSGDILSDPSEALVNTVNCVGVMGRGIALQFKKAWPENFKAYSAACKRDEVIPGRMFVFDRGLATAPRYIINFPTKRHWRGKSRLEDVQAGLDALVAVVTDRSIRSIAVPPLGAGLGGLPWVEVRRCIEHTLGGLSNTVVRVYEPKGAPAPDAMVRTKKAPRMTAGRAALLGLLHRYIRGLLDPFITLLEVQKLMYFLQEAGQPLKLDYVPHHYGPYADNLRHVLNEIEGHWVTGYADGGDSPDKSLELVPGAIERAEAYLKTHGDTRVRFDRVSELVDGFESPFGLELLSTVHWVLSHQSAPADMAELVDRVHRWNSRKREFTPRQIGIAADVLDDKGWVTLPWTEST